MSRPQSGALGNRYHECSIYPLPGVQLRDSLAVSRERAGRVFYGSVFKAKKEIWLPLAEAPP